VSPMASAKPQLASSDEWLAAIGPRLTQAGFVLLHPQGYQSAGFKYVLRRTQFEITKFGMAETFFAFADLPVLVPQTMVNFSAAAYQLAMRSKTVPLPCGCFESVFCFPVAITSQLDPRMAEWIRQTQPPKHFASCEMPVAYDLTTRTLCYFEHTPLWGAAYFAGFRQQIQMLLG